MASKQARKLARVALGLADRGGVSKDMQAAMESEEKAFEKRLEDGESFEDLMVEAEKRRSGAGGKQATPKMRKLEEPPSGEGVAALQQPSGGGFDSLTSQMVQQMLARQQEDHEAAVSKRKLEEQERALELQQKRQALEAEAAAQRLKLAKEAKSSGLDAHLSLILGGGSTDVEPAAVEGGAKEQPAAAPKNQGGAKAVAAAAAKTPPGSPAAAGSHGTPRRGRAGAKA